jgi:hypothetical protein
VGAQSTVVAVGGAGDGCVDAGAGEGTTSTWAVGGGSGVVAGRSGPAQAASVPRHRADRRVARKARRNGSSVQRIEHPSLVWYTRGGVRQPFQRLSPATLRPATRAWFLRRGELQGAPIVLAVQVAQLYP